VFKEESVVMRFMWLCRTQTRLWSDFGARTTRTSRVHQLFPILEDTR